MEQYSYTSTHPLGHTGPVTGSLYLYLFMYNSGVLLTDMFYLCVITIQVGNLQKENPLIGKYRI